MNRLISILFGCLMTVASYATSYYVSNSGSDSNDGLSSSTPYARPESASLSNGDSLLFERGCHWDSVALGFSGLDDPTFAAYGTGAMPIITVYDTLEYQSVSDDIYVFYHSLLNVDYYTYTPYADRGGWKRWENNYGGFLLDNSRNHYELARYQAAGVYSEITDVGDSSTWFKCNSLSSTESNDYHNDAGLKVQTRAWTAESSSVDDYNDSDGKFNVSNLISAGSKSLYYLDPDFDHQIFLYGHRNYLLNNQVDNEWAFTDGTNTRDGYIWIYNDSDISSDNYYLSIDTAVFSFVNCDNVNINNLEIHGGHKAGVLFYGCDSTVIDSCKFKYVHMAAFSDDGGDCYFTYDTIEHSTNYGIFYQYGSNYNFNDNYMYNIGTSEGIGGDGDVSFNGIFARYHDDSAKAYRNRIDSVGRNGIHFKGDVDNLTQYMEMNYVSSYTNYVQDAAAYYISGSSGTSSTKRIRNNISSHGLYYNTGFHCRETTHSQGIYLDTDTRGVLIDSNFIIEANRGVLFNGTDTNIVRDNVFIDIESHGLRFVDISYGHYGTGTIDCEAYKNIVLLSQANAYGSQYLCWAYSTSSPSYYFDGKGSDMDSNTYVNPHDATDQTINMERFYSDYPHSLTAWTDTTENVLGSGNGWEEYSTAPFINHFASVSGSIDADQCIVPIANWTTNSQEVNLYDLTFYRSDSTEVSGSITIQPYKGVDLIYKSGTASNIDLLPYVIEEDIVADVKISTGYNRLSRRIKIGSALYKVLTPSELFEVWYEGE